jgi:ketosteroid isomerase-like protein
MDDRIVTIERMYELFAAGDIDGVMELCVPDPVVTQDPALPWGGRFVGRDAVIEFAMKLAGTTDSKVTHEQLFAAGDQVVQQGRTAGTVRGTGAAFDIPECHVWTFRDGLIAEAAFYLDSAAMLEVLAR